MLFWIFVGCLVLGIVLMAVATSHWAYRNDFDSLFLVPGTTLMVISAVAVIVSLVGICCEHIGTDGYVAGLMEERKSLVYQFENDIYDNTFDVGKRELMEDITEWNKTIVKGRENQNDFWLGIYYADIYDQFELIELEATE